MNSHHKQLASIYCKTTVFALVLFLCLSCSPSVIVHHEAGEERYDSKLPYENGFIFVEKGQTMSNQAISSDPFNKIWYFFSSVRLTVVLLLSLAATSIIGTLIPQNESPQAYLQAFGPSLYRFFDLLGFFRSEGFAPAPRISLERTLDPTAPDE